MTPLTRLVCVCVLQIKAVQVLDHAQHMTMWWQGCRLQSFCKQCTQAGMLSRGAQCSSGWESNLEVDCCPVLEHLATLLYNFLPLALAVLQTTENHISGPMDLAQPLSWAHNKSFSILFNDPILAGRCAAC